MHAFYSDFTHIDFAAYIERVEKQFFQCGPSEKRNWDNRTIDVTNEPIAKEVQDFLEQRLNCSLNLNHAQIQIWPVGSKAVLHKHVANGREGTDYNSLLYLNDNFEGGEFYTEHGLSFKPKQGMLTFFNGKEVLHGLKDVHGGNRYTIIFWWQNTKFNYSNEQVPNPI